MELTSKSKILEQMQLKGDPYSKELAKTLMSDQMLERMQASADKKARV